MLLIDSLLVGGIRFVIEKLTAAVEAELNDDSHLREELLAAQMRLELGELSEEEFVVFEREILARLRQIRERQKPSEAETGDLKITSVEIDLDLE
jgi:Gas vesicle protein G